MGQNSSVSVEGRGDVIQERYPKQELVLYFHKKVKTLLRPIEITSVTSKSNTTNLNEKSILTPSDLAYLLQLSSNKEESIESAKLLAAVQLLHDSCKVFASFPFLSELDFANLLTLDGAIAASMFHCNRLGKILPDLDYKKLLYLSLCRTNLTEYITDKRMSTSAASPSLGGKEAELSEKTKSSSSATAIFLKEPETEHVARRILWRLMPVVKNLDNIDVTDITTNAYDIQQLLALLLMVKSIPKALRSKMQQEFKTLSEQKWLEFEDAALCVLKHIDIGLTTSNIRQASFTYEDIFESEFQLVATIITEQMKSIFQDGFLSANYQQEAGELPQELQSKSTQFADTKLVNRASVTIMGSLFDMISSDIQITTENMIKLYIGREAGFSIRSLELKIFKWAAPTILIVSGKRVKGKTISNRRYQQFDEEYPRYFRALETHLQPWQHDNDRLTYAVLVSLPWTISNKKNFGNSDCMIMTLSPYLDYYKSSNNAALGSALVYFNTLGLGLGFGNDQPINKNGVRKYLPGNVSLTIESNLEYAVFRHVSSAKTSQYFEKSRQKDLAVDYEDRFVITDLEVWGVGSTKELEQQKKQWEWEQKQAEARQSVNMDRLKEDRAFLEMVGLVGNTGSGGSV